MDTNYTQGLLEMPSLHRGANRMTKFGQSEVEISLSSELQTACCGEELRPFWTDDGRFVSACRRCGQKYTDKTQARYGGSHWIGIDLDGTLAHDPGNKDDFGEIGRPIMPMLNRLGKWIADGKTVKIFTARASSPRQVVMIKEWLAGHGLPDLEVTNVKDRRMIELWDDRCVQVTTNLGEPIGKNTAHNRNRQMSMRGLGGRLKSSGLLSRLKIFLTL
jgi:hypothetical protein